MRVLLVNLCFFAVWLSASASRKESHDDLFEPLAYLANPQAAVFYTQGMTQALLSGNKDLKRDKRSPDPPPGKGKKKAKPGNGGGPRLVYDPNSENDDVPFSGIPLHSTYADLSAAMMEVENHDGENIRNRRSMQEENLPNAVDGARKRKRRDKPSFSSGMGGMGSMGGMGGMDKMPGNFGNPMSQMSGGGRQKSKKGRKRRAAEVELADEDKDNSFNVDDNQPDKTSETKEEIVESGDDDKQPSEPNV